MQISRNAKPQQDAARKLREQILSQIEKGELKPGDSLLPEREMSETLKMPLSAVRSALQQLTDLGHLVRRRGAGTFVSESVNAGQSVQAGQKRDVLILERDLRGEKEGQQFVTQFMEIAGAAEEYLVEHGVSVVHEKDRAELVEERLKREAGRLGAVLCAICKDHEDALKKYSVPVIGVNYINESDIGAYVDGVRIDDLAGSYETTRYLIKCGHQHISYIVGDPDHIVDSERLIGYERAMQEAELDKNIFVEQALYPEQVENGYKAMLRMLVKRRDTTAVATANDHIAFGAIRALNEVGISVPDEVSVMGFHDWELAAHMTPPLTTMRIDRTQLGQVAGRLVLERLDNPTRAGRLERLPATLIERGSVATVGTPLAKPVSALKD